VLFGTCNIHIKKESNIILMIVTKERFDRYPNSKEQQKMILYLFFSFHCLLVAQKILTLRLYICTLAIGYI